MRLTFFFLGYFWRLDLGLCVWRLISKGDGSGTMEKDRLIGYSADNVTFQEERIS